MIQRDLSPVRTLRDRVIVADPQRLFLHALPLMLESEFDVVATARDGSRLLTESARLKPAIVLCEAELGDMTSIDAIARLRELNPQVKVMIVTDRTDALTVQQALGAGANGYILKRCSPEELQLALREVAAGRLYFTPELKRASERAAKSPAWRNGADTPAALTSREREILRLVALGHTARAIAAMLSISVKTVAFHKNNVRQKLRVRSAAEMAAFAIRTGILAMHPAQPANSEAAPPALEDDTGRE
ncbi:MAG: response regulator transcription factor [Bryobacterales bacterium]|nr:response regulator transcription factor [Bryobacterales bacterium]